MFDKIDVMQFSIIFFSKSIKIGFISFLWGNVTTSLYHMSFSHPSSRSCQSIPRPSWQTRELIALRPPKTGVQSRTAGNPSPYLYRHLIRSERTQPYFSASVVPYYSNGA